MEELATRLKWSYQVETEAIPESPPEPLQAPVEPPKPMTPPELLYSVAKDSLGTHMTLDESVDKSVGCAEAVSAVLKHAGVPGIPKRGIAGTAQLSEFLRASPSFTKIPAYEVGAVIISPTGSGNGRIRGHVGICANHGILSNESQTGLFKEQWDLPSWTAYYGTYGGFPLSYYRYNGNN